MLCADMGFLDYEERDVGRLSDARLAWLSLSDSFVTTRTRVRKTLAFDGASSLSSKGWEL